MVTQDTPQRRCDNCGAPVPENCNAPCRNCGQAGT